MTSSVDAARMIDALEEALQSCRHTYDRHVQRKMFVEALHKSGFHITPIEHPASHPAWARLGMTEAEGEVLDEVAGLTAPERTGTRPYPVGTRVRVTESRGALSVGQTGILDRWDDQTDLFKLLLADGSRVWCSPEMVEPVIKEPAS